MVLVPANTERHLLVDFLEHLSLLEIAKAFRELTCRAPDPGIGTRRSRGDPGRLTGRPGRAGRRSRPARWWTAVPSRAWWPRSRNSGPTQAVVITRPHAVSDTFHTDWANKAQDQLGIPVLHLYAGSGFIGDS